MLRHPISFYLIYASQILLQTSVQSLNKTVCPFLPWQERSSVRSLKPFLQLHSKLPMVFLQKCSQPPLWSSHSSISVGNRRNILAGLPLQIHWVKSLFQQAAALCGGVFVDWQPDLCRFFHPAAVWSRWGSCSERPWMCLYRCSRTHHCLPRRFLKLHHTTWM